MTHRDDELIASFLADGPNHGRPAALDAAFAAVRSARQRPNWLVGATAGTFDDDRGTLLRMAPMLVAVALVGAIAGALVVANQPPNPKPAPIVVPSASAGASQLAGRWISVDVANATDTDHRFAIVDQRDPTRVVGVAKPATVLGRATQQLRLFVPDDIPWTLRSNGVEALNAHMVDGWCGDLPITINLAEGIVDAAVPAFVHSGPGNCLGPVPPIRMTLYMRDQSVMGIGWKISSGSGVAAQGIVSEQPTARCFIVPYDWVLDFWVAEDFMDREDRHAGNFLTTAADVPPAPDLTLAIDIQVTSLPDVSWGGIPDWWRGPEPDCPELPDPPG
jgi:hypothetical protein